MRPQWLNVISLAGVTFALCAWCFQRNVCSKVLAWALLILSVGASLGQHLTETVGDYAPLRTTLLGMGQESWIWIDRIVASCVGTASVAYACIFRANEALLLGALGLGFLIAGDVPALKETSPYTYAALHSIWHTLAYGALALLMVHNPQKPSKRPSETYSELSGELSGELSSFRRNTLSVEMCLQDVPIAHCTSY